MHDYAAVVHVHSTHSDGTGTVGQIARAAREALVDVVLLTDHDSLGARVAGEDGWHDGVLVICGTEVSPGGGDHYLAFGVDRTPTWLDRPAREVIETIDRMGGFGFAAHPFATGKHFRLADPMPHSDLEGPITGVELWAFLADTGEELHHPVELAAFLLDPMLAVDHPPERNLREWDRLCSERRVVGIGGLDAHQLGLRALGIVWLRLMAYRRTFGYLRTHVLTGEPLVGEKGRDTRLVLDALRSGHCYIALDAVAPAHGFEFGASGPGGKLVMGDEARSGGWTLRATAPESCSLTLVRNGEPCASASGTSVEHLAEAPGVYRIEARRSLRGRERTWILSNPIYLR